MKRLARRDVLVAGLAGAAGACVPLDTSAEGRLAARLRIIEAASGGILGVAILDTGSGAMLGLNRQARFAQCSTFKLSLAAMVLKRTEEGQIDPERRLSWSQDELLSVSPFTAENLVGGATAIELARAAQVFSDNTAANVLLRNFGGPEALTEFWRRIDDEASRLDRFEPQLNNVPPGELRDTATPEAAARTVARLCFGEVLSEENRALLRNWTSETRTGLKRVRAGLPEGWAAGDKTGTSTWPGSGGLYADIGYAMPPGQAPITFAAYLRGRDPAKTLDAAQADQAFAGVGRVLAMWAGR